MTLKNGSSSACAACKYQRRRCTPDCILAPHFPADQPRLFQNAHKLFGVSNIIKILKPLDTKARSEAMRSITFQSYIRDRMPVDGCLGLIHHLESSIWMAKQELDIVNAHLEMCIQQNNSTPQFPPDINDQSNNAILDNNCNYSNSLSLVDCLPVAQPYQQQFDYPYNSDNVIPYSDSLDSREITAVENSQFLIQQQDAQFLIQQQDAYAIDNNNCAIPIQSQSQPQLIASRTQQHDAYASDNNNCAIQIQSQIASQTQQHDVYASDNNNCAIPIQSQQTLDVQPQIVRDYPLFDTIDDQQYSIDELYSKEPSSEESLKDRQHIDFIEESDLKSEAVYPHLAENQHGHF